VIAFSVFALSFATLGYELALARWLAIAHWDTLAFVVIGIAMFGLAAGGAAWQAWPGRRSGQSTAATRLCLAGSIATAGSFLAAKALPLDWLRLPADPLQITWLAAASLLLSLPFVCSGMLSCMAYAAMAPRTGIVSAAGMAGSASGAVCFLLLLPVLEEGRLVTVLAGVALLPALGLSLPRFRHGFGSAGITVGAIVTGVCLTLGAGLDDGRLFAITPSPWQTLPQLLLLPGTRVISREAGTWGRLSEVESPYIRFAPGLSLQASQPVPSQRGLVTDGDSLTVLHDPGSVAFARSTHAWAGYVLAGIADPDTGPRWPGRVLVIHGDGGLATACALASGSTDVTVVTENEGLAARLGSWYSRADAGIRVVADNPRSFLARQDGSWDLIHIEKWGPSVPGMAALSQTGLLTVDALAAAWNRLTGRGVLLVSRRLLVPPSDSVRILSSAAAALRGAGVRDPSEHLAVIRGTESVSVIVSRAPLRGALRAALRSFADRLGFDLDWFPGMTLADADKFQRFERPFFFEAYRDALADAGFAASYPLDVAPQTDDRPFPNRFLRWTRIADFTGLAGGRLSGLLLSTELVGGASLIVSIAGAAALVCLPLILRGRRQPPAGRGATPVRGSAALIAACAFTGAGFLLVEICVIDVTGFLFPGPLVPLALGLGTLLGFGTLGGLASLRLGNRGLLAVLAGLAVLFPCLGLLLVRGAHLALPLATVPRALVSVAGFGIPGFLLGVPFPLLLRRIAPSSGMSLAWAVNGCASVLASSAAGLIAAGAGLSILLMLGGACYLAAAGAVLAARLRPTQRSPGIVPGRRSAPR
jgi:hypothetical protein